MSAKIPPGVALRAYVDCLDAVYNKECNWEALDRALSKLRGAETVCLNHAAWVEFSLDARTYDGAAREIARKRELVHKACKRFAKDRPK